MTLRALFRSPFSLTALLLIFTLQACGSSSPTAPTGPDSTAPPASQTGLTINADASSRHVAKFVAEDGSVLDFWTDDTGEVSDVRLRSAAGRVAYLQLDSVGQLSYFEDTAGNSLRVHSYLNRGRVDVTITNGSGDSWRGVLDPTAAATSTSVLAHSSSAVVSPRARTPLATAEDIRRMFLQLSVRFCESPLPDLITAIDLSSCLLGILVAAPTGPGAIIGCAVAAAAGELAKELWCGYYSQALEAAGDPTRVVTSTLPEPLSPLPRPTTDDSFSPVPNIVAVWRIDSSLTSQDGSCPSNLSALFGTGTAVVNQFGSNIVWIDNSGLINVGGLVTLQGVMSPGGFFILSGRSLNWPGLDPRLLPIDVQVNGDIQAAGQRLDGTVQVHLRGVDCMAVGAFTAGDRR